MDRDAATHGGEAGLVGEIVAEVKGKGTFELRLCKETADGGAFALK